MATFSDLVNGATGRAVSKAAPFVPSLAEVEAEYQHIMYFLDDLKDPWSFIKESHRGAGSPDAYVSEMYKRHCAK